MRRFSMSSLGRMILAGFILGSFAVGQSSPGQSSQGQAVASQSAVTPADPPASGPPAATSAKTTPATADPDNALDPASVLPDLPKLRPTKASLIGGTVEKLDRLRDQLTVQIFGGGKMKIAFDPRTRILNNAGGVATVSDLHRGDRVYIDTILNNGVVFAKNIRLRSGGMAGESQGIVLGYSPDNGELEVRDMLSPTPLKVRVTPQTRLIDGDHSANASELAPGNLVAIKFGAQRGGDVAEEVKVLAVQGADFMFGGTVTALDLRLGILVLTSSTDHKSYEIALDPSLIPADDSLHPGVDVTVVSRFDGNKYQAKTVTVNRQRQ
jgi:Domain of unknown function (DUF5666)